ncbi:hypothetical protein K456DRAFT_1188884 [Colletotrichum gloeosporioides 23]|nr:hypothetical protein K456DRAFT_1188884 [Colletotrichum gloeosporioides 23]
MNDENEAYDTALWAFPPHPLPPLLPPPPSLPRFAVRRLPIFFAAAKGKNCVSSRVVVSEWLPPLLFQSRSRQRSSTRRCDDTFRRAHSHEPIRGAARSILNKTSCASCGFTIIFLGFEKLLRVFACVLLTRGHVSRGFAGRLALLCCMLAPNKPRIITLKKDCKQHAGGSPHFHTVQVELQFGHQCLMPPREYMYTFFLSDLLHIVTASCIPFPIAGNV